MQGPTRQFARDRAREKGSTMRARLKKPVALVGMMGAGKTAVGQALARRLGVPFVDSDSEIVKAANMSIAEIFERDGEPFFRLKERQVLRRLITGEPAILSTGGGAYLASENREIISRNGVAVWLKVDIATLWSRVRHKDTRPLLRTADPRATLERIASEREPVYALADLTAEADPSYSVADMAEEVTRVLATRTDILERTHA
ncbi:shikimate kinase [Tropicimonas sp. IMCC34011]|uniref:shikimate kinase n=1 Tax=Tropicimonas sp. IMCC34011 TaxID=2248759 RepID=UPI002100D795|nr:shikimate kinase [Tropicimonas sp. IMCC34011]